ncbi:MAG: signal peptidase II [Actinomycetota bacterium]
MRQKSTYWKLVLIVAWGIWLLDVGSKSWALWRLSDGSSFKVIGSLLTFNLSRNTGAAFSIAPGGAGFLGAFSVIVILVILFWMRKINSRPWGVVLGLVLGGCIGNLTDRLFRTSTESGSSLGKGIFGGRVVDWIELPHWPIFNVADSAIVIAAVIAGVLSLRNIPPITPPHIATKSEE